jgi:hypothetical protein
LALGDGGKHVAHGLRDDLKHELPRNLGVPDILPALKDGGSKNGSS